jgi:hypothetical protein
MENIQTAADLKRAIVLLEEQQHQDWNLLKEQYLVTKENFKFKNIIKNSFKDVVSSHNITTDIATTAIGLTTGFLSKRLLFGSTINPLKKIVGYLLEMAVANKVMTNADGIKTVGGALINKFFKKKKNEVMI